MLFAESNSVTRPNGRSAVGATIELYATADPADLDVVNDTCVDTLGDGLSDPFLVDQWSRIPDFYAGVGVTFLYVSVDGGDRTMISAKSEARLQVLEATAGSLDSDITTLTAAVNNVTTSAGAAAGLALVLGG
jgi:hypothetical protein